jgi:glucosamine--fructose-6-phosphate aminotransferase (isomerizing)
MVYGFQDSFRMAVEKLEGTYAIVALHKDFPDLLMIARRDSPLMVGVSKDSVYVASDILAFDKEVTEIAQIDDGTVTSLTRDSLSKWGLLGTKVVLSDNNKGTYQYYMLKEIEEQPETLLKALKQDKNKLFSISLDIMRARTFILTACGTSRFASIVGRYLMSRLAKKMGEVIVGSELHYFTDSFDDSTLVLAVSQSGETADVLSGIQLAKKHGSRVISIVNKPYSSLERLSDVTLFMNCGAEISVASTKAFTSELILFYLLSFTMAGKYDEGMQELSLLPEKIKECLSQKDKIEMVAKVIKNAEHIYYIGKGINFAVSGECALKLKEISYIHAESMSAGELKHGTLSLVEKGIPIIGLCPDDYTYQETISNLHEAKARKGLIIGISDKNNSVFDYWLQIPKVRDIYYPLMSVIIGQLLAYDVAVGKGLNVDFPRSLAKSVTVR